MSATLPYSETVRVNQIGAGLSRRLETNVPRSLSSEALGQARWPCNPVA